MIYVLELNGKGSDKADSVTFRVFAGMEAAEVYINEFTRTGDKYWTRFVYVGNNDEIDNLYS